MVKLHLLAAVRHALTVGDVVARIRSVLIVLGLCTAWSTVPRAQADAGKTAYDRGCQVCHGPEGRGDAGPSLVPLDKGYDEVLAIVREGNGEMPPISSQRISDEDVKRIVEYLKSFEACPMNTGQDRRVGAYFNSPGPGGGSCEFEPCGCRRH